MPEAIIILTAWFACCCLIILGSWALVGTIRFLLLLFARTEFDAIEVEWIAGEWRPKPNGRRWLSLRRQKCHHLGRRANSQAGHPSRRRT